MRPFLRFALLVLSFNSFIVRAHNGPDPESSSTGAGEVAFENSGPPQAQKDFEYGLAQLHNFQYESAAEAFRRVQQIDPNFALAFWGEAMTYDHPVWVEENVAAARAVLNRLAPTPIERRQKAKTAREQAYMDAVEILFGEGTKADRDRRYALAMERVHRTYPTDIDATCFYALALLGSVQGVRDVPTYMQSAALMEDVFEQHPKHPGAAHYLIHSVDDSAHAPLGLRAADAYSKIAPDSPHALHMTSHIYLAMGMWQKTVAANEASSQIGRAAFLRKNPTGTPPGCGHGKQWLAYAYLQQERFESARQIVAACAQEMRSGQSARTSADPYAASELSAIGAYYAARARFLLDSEAWDDPLAQIESESISVPVAAFRREVTNAFVLLRKGNPQAAAAVARAEQAANRLLDAGRQNGLTDDHPQQEATRIELDEVRALLRWREGQRDAALALLREAAHREQALPMDFGPPTIYKPANELLGEVLLDAGRADAARDAFYQAQRLAPGRTKSLLGLAKCAAQLKDQELAASVNAKLEQTRKEAQLTGKL